MRNDVNMFTLTSYWHSTKLSLILTALARIRYIYNELLNYTITHVLLIQSILLLWISSSSTIGTCSTSLNRNFLLINKQQIRLHIQKSMFHGTPDAYQTTHSACQHILHARPHILYVHESKWIHSQLLFRYYSM